MSTFAIISWGQVFTTDAATTRDGGIPRAVRFPYGKFINAPGVPVCISRSSRIRGDATSIWNPEAALGHERTLDRYQMAGSFIGTTRTPQIRSRPRHPQNSPVPDGKGRLNPPKLPTATTCMGPGGVVEAVSYTAAMHLLPCPFCLGEKIDVIDDEAHVGDALVAVCSECGARFRCD